MMLCGSRGSMYLEPRCLKPCHQVARSVAVISCHRTVAKACRGDVPTRAARLSDLRGYQQKAVQAVMQAIAQGLDRQLIAMPTGSGGNIMQVYELFGCMP